MKQSRGKLIAVLISILLIITSCKKEPSCEGCIDKSNKSPIAIAGPDQVITLPADSVLLDGKQSSDPDGIISSYLWTKISGPASFNILKPSDSITKVKALVAGTYLFELKVTDNGGLSAKDTLKVTVDPVITTNHPPIANAGADQTITLLANTVTLDGSASTDLENNITSYIWAKISGPASFNIVNSNAVQTQVANIIEGIYQFELKVTDAGALFSKDTVQIIVQPVVQTNCDTSNRPNINSSFTFITQFPQQRYRATFVTSGSKVFIAGGHTSFSGNQPINFSDRVDIYDITTGQWTTSQLSEARIVDAAVVMENKIFFAGGRNTSGERTTVDIYDVSANTWSTGQLSQARGGMIAGSINNKILFAGGVNIPDLFSTVDIYSTGTNSWSTASLSGAKYTPSNFAYSTTIPTTVDQKIFFAGGQSCWIVDCPSNRIEIYDAVLNTWSFEDYIPYVPGAYLFSGIAAGNKNYWITGDYWEGGNLVEIRDELTHSTSYECLSGVLFGHPVKNNNKLIFPISALPMSTSSYRLTHFDIYDLATNTWSISKLPVPLIYHQLIYVNNEIYEIGGNVTPNGYLEDKIYKLKF